MFVLLWAYHNVISNDKVRLVGPWSTFIINRKAIVREQPKFAGYLGRVLGILDQYKKS